MLTLLVRHGAEIRIDSDQFGQLAGAAVWHSNGSLTISIPAGDRAKELACGQTFTITFNAGERVMEFTAPLIQNEFSPDSFTNELVFGAPAEICTEDRRLNARVSLVPDKVHLFAKIDLDGNTWTCQVWDISHAGLRVDVPRPDGSESLEGKDLRIAVSYRGVDFETIGQIRWLSSGCSAGVYLPEMEDVDARQITHPWVKIVQLCLAEVCALDMAS